MSVSILRMCLTHNIASEISAVENCNRKVPDLWICVRRPNVCMTITCSYLLLSLFKELFIVII